MGFMPINKYEHDLTNNNIAQGCVTNSKHPDRFVKGVYPTHVTRGKDCYLFTAEGEQYIDYICGLGTNLFGYGNDNIVSYRLRKAYMGDCLSLPSVYESEAAIAVKTIIPWAHKVKFLNDGSSACHASIIMARAYAQQKFGDKKFDVYSAGYHGWHSEFTALTEPAHGCSQASDYIHKLPDNLEDIDISRAAAIIIEPVELDDSSDRQKYLMRLKEFCEKNKIVLIFDEIITGMRYPKFAVSNFWNIQPDLILMSKAIANGAKIAIVAGHSDIMDNDYFVSGTFHGEIYSLVSLIATTTEARTNRSWDMMSLKQHGLWFCEQFNEMFKPYDVQLKGWGSRAAFQGNKLNIALIWQELIKARYLFGPSFFLNNYLMKHSDEVLYFCSQIVQLMKLSKLRLEGSMPSSPFSAKVRS